MELRELLAELERYLPPDTAMEGDRNGLQLQSGRTQVHSIMATMELNDAVVAEAVERGVECIVSFHPLIFRPLGSLHENERVGRLCTKLIQNGIALVIAHTTFDAYPEGTSHILAARLGLEVLSTLEADERHAGYGMGVLARPHSPIRPAELLERVHGACHGPLRYTEGATDRLERIAIVGGSGASFIPAALKAGADALLTADIKYHDFHRVHGVLWLIDPGHYEMEQYVARGLAGILEKIVAKGNSSVTVRTSQVVPNPVRYFPGGDSYRTDQMKTIELISQ